MRQAMEETDRRRAIQEAHNRRHAITPEGIRKAVADTFDFRSEPSAGAGAGVAEPPAEAASMEELEEQMRGLEIEMRAAAKELDFERAVELRDRITALRRLLVLEVS
jgi:excinuclease ABC subunit B